MISSIPFDGWGNKVIQYCFARALGSELDYYVNCKKIPFLPNSGNWNFKGQRINTPKIIIDHKSKYRHYVDISELKSMTPCHFNIRSYLEYYPNISNYREQIRSDWCYIPDNLDEECINNNLKVYNNGKFSRMSIDNITPRDLVVSVRLGRDYLGQHRYRLLLGDYFKIIIDSIDYDRLFVTSQDPFNPILEDLYPYNPIMLQHVSALHTFNFIRRFNKIILSQSTYSWWAAYLSEAQEIYFPITKDGPWSYGADQRAKWKDYKHDLMVDEPRYHYVSYRDRSIVGDYNTTRDYLKI